MSFLSQLLSQGAAKSRADYNTQQQINELLRQGWVPKGQGGMEDPTAAADPAVAAADPVIAEEDPMDPAITKEGIEAIYNSGDPKLAEILNEMLSSVGKGEIEYYSLGDTSPEAENQRRLDRRELYPEHYLEEQKRQDEANATPGRDPNIPDEFGRSTFFDEGKDIDIVGSAQYSSSTPEDFRNYVNSFAREEKEAQQDNINPDPESRNFVKKAFKDVRSGIDGFSPAGEEAGHWLKPIAEQLNSMFGRSAPLDMDGYEMGPYHAQRISREKMEKEDIRDKKKLEVDVRRVAAQEEANNINRNYYDQLSEIRKQDILLKAQQALLKHDTDVKKLAKELKEVKASALPSEERLKNWSLRKDRIFEALTEIVDDTWIAEYVGDYGYQPWEWDALGGDIDGIMPTLYLMLGKNEDGTDDPDNWGLFDASPEKKREIEDLLQVYRDIQEWERSLPGLQYEAATGSTILERTSKKRSKDLERELVEQVKAVIDMHQKSDPLSTRSGKDD